MGVPEEAEIVKRMIDVYKGTKSGTKLREDLDLMLRRQGLGCVFLKVLWKLCSLILSMPGKSLRTGNVLLASMKRSLTQNFFIFKPDEAA